MIYAATSKLFVTLVGVCVLSSAAIAATPSANPLSTVAVLDVPRYMGTWFEIAKYPNRFQKKCVSNTQAQYAPLADGSVRVTNRCTTEDGSLSEAVGAARLVGDAGSPKLKVRFAPAWLSFIPAVWGGYWVIDLDPQYQLAAVSEPKREYLWILARTPTVSPKAYAELLTRLEQAGFDLRKLETTPQEK